MYITAYQTNKARIQGIAEVNNIMDIYRWLIPKLHKINKTDIPSQNNLSSINPRTLKPKSNTSIGD